MSFTGKAGSFADNSFCIVRADCAASVARIASIVAVASGAEDCAVAVRDWMTRKTRTMIRITARFKLHLP
jgi:hypothetical protein